MLKSLKKQQNKQNLAEEKQVKSWYVDSYQAIAIQRNALFLFTAAALISVGMSVIFLKRVMASKSLEPYVIEIEEKTGVPTIVDQQTVEKYSSDEVIKRYFISEYIMAREGYEAATYQNDYFRVTRLLSSNEVYGIFVNKVSSRNANSPINKLGRDGTIKAKFKSIQFLNPQTAQIRLSIEETGRNSGTIKKDAIVIMSFQFIEMTLPQDERYINPLGFQVTGYRIDDELVNN